MIRETRGLHPNAKITAEEARKAALAAFIGVIYQGGTGSCFATSVAIIVHSDCPRLFVDDIKSIIERGEFVREVDGKTITFTPPKEIFNAILEDEIQIENGCLYGQPLEAYPSIVNALKGTGIPERAWKELIQYVPPISMQIRKILQSIIMQYNEISQADYDQLRMYKEIGDKVTRLEMIDLPELEEKLKLGQSSALSREIEEKEELIMTLGEEYSEGVKDFEKTAERIARTDKMLDSAINNLTSTRYNKLLYTWELTLASRGERFGLFLSSGIFKDLKSELYSLLDSKVQLPWNENSKLKNEFEDLFNKRMGTKYENGKFVFF